MAASKQPAVTAVFHERSDAEAAWNWLIDSGGYRAREVKMLTSASSKGELEQGLPVAKADIYNHALAEGGVVINIVPHNPLDASTIVKKFIEFHGDEIVIG